MNKIALFSIIAIVFMLLILLVVAIIFAKKMAKNKKQEPALKIKPKKRALNLDDLLAIVKDQSSSKEQISSALIHFCNLTFPPRGALKELNDEQKKHLSFITFIMTHKKTDSKMVAFLDKELKNKNPDYADDIETYEHEGLKKRG